MLVVITGGIASGKTSGSNIIRSLGYKVIDLDQIAKDQMDQGSPSYFEVLHAFGPGVLNEDGSIDRKALAGLVFNNKDKLSLLNKITHKYIFEDLKKQVDSFEEGILFLDIPLYFETYESFKSYGIDVDKVILIYTPMEVQISRIIARDGRTREMAEAMISSQLDIGYKKARSDYLISNDSSLEDLELAIRSTVEKIEFGG